MRNIPNNISTLIMSDSSSVTSLPTESELDLELAEFVNWQRFAAHLPDLTRGDIEQIEQDDHDVQRQKLELYETWLRICRPNASWNDIVLSLENTRETTLADIIKIKFNVVISSDSFVSSATEVHSQVQESFNQDIIVKALKKLYRSFTSLAKDIRGKLDELVKSRKLSINE